MVEANASAWRLGDLVPPQWRQVMAALGPGDIPGSASKADAIAVWRNWQMGWRCRQGMKLSGMPSSKHNGPWPTGSMLWLRRRPTCLHHLACGVVRRPGECVQAASSHNAMNVSGQVTSGIVATRWPMRRRPSSTSLGLQSDLDKPGGTCLGSWSATWAQRERAGGRGWTLMLLLSSLVMQWGGTLPRCGAWMMAGGTHHRVLEAIRWWMPAMLYMWQRWPM